MKIMYAALLFVLLLSIMLAKKGGDTLKDSPYVLKKVSDPPAGYEVEDTSQVWEVTFILLRHESGMTDKDVDSLYSESFVSMEQFMFFAEVQKVIVSNPALIRGSENGEAMSFLFSVSKKVDKEKLMQILESSFFGSPMKKADACRLFPF